MGTTARGLEVSTADPDAIEALDRFTDRLARISPGAEEIAEIAARTPGVACLELAAATLFAYAQTAEGDRTATAHLDRAGGAADLAEREQAWLDGLRRWLANDLLAAVEVFEALLRSWPRDVLALKALEFLYYLTGQQHNGPRFLAAVEALAPDNAGDPDVLAVLAFAAELAGQPDRALDVADEAIAAAADNSWAHHAVAHALITRGDPESAVERLAGYLPIWERSARPVWCHNAWHLAVANLDRLDVGPARAILGDQVWGVTPDAPVEQVDAASLLWRIELAGFESDEATLADLADHVTGRVGECYHPFLSAHHAWVLARAERSDELEVLLRTVGSRAALGDDEARRVWQPVGLAVVEACAAHGAGDRRRCATLLDPVMARFTMIGGSDAQDDLFRQAYLDALIASGRGDDARRWYEQMTAWKTPSPLDHRFAERVGAAR